MHMYVCVTPEARTCGLAMTAFISLVFCRSAFGQLLYPHREMDPERVILSVWV
jgi:hypothetical protein